MPLFPLMLSLADELENINSGSYLDDFGLGFFPHRHYNNRIPNIQLSLPPLNTNEEENKEKRNYGQLTNKSSDLFEVNIIVNNFEAHEISVKAFEKYIIVEGKQGEHKDEFGYITRNFIRKLLLPNGYDANMAVSTLFKNGILHIKVPKIKIKEDIVTV